MKKLLNLCALIAALLIALSVRPASVVTAQSSALTTADTALLDGDYATAVAQYTAAASDPASKCAALYGLGVAYFRAEDDSDANAAFSAELSGGGCSPSYEALIMRGEAREQLGQSADALADYQQAMTLKPGLLDSYLYERMAALAPDQSVYYLRLATEAPRQPESEFALREKLAQVYLMVGSPQSALTEYNTVLQEIDTYLAQLSQIDGATFDTDGSIRARLELAAAQIEIDNGQPDAGYTRMQKIITNYQQSSSALQALIDLVQAGQSVDLLNRMRINVLNQNYSPVVSVLTDTLSSAPASTPAELYLLLGEAQRGLGDTTSALATFAQLRQLYPRDPMASTAALEEGNTDLDTQDYDKAIAAFTDVAASYPQSPEAPQAVLSAAETERDHGDQSRALADYDQLGKLYPTSDQAKTGLFEAGLLIRDSDAARAESFFAQAGTSEGLVWQGKLLEQAGSSDAAKQAWQQALNAEPDTLFSIRACELLNGIAPLTPLPLSGAVSAPADPAAAAQWVAQAFKLPSADASLAPDLANDPMLQRGVELWKVGMYGEARNELDTLHKLRRDDPLALLQLAYYYQSVPIYRSSLLAATRLIYSANVPLLTIPDAVLRLAFPLDYADLIIPLAQQNDLDPLLVAALIRQESSFDPTVDSIADARGLMQFVPATAQDVADQLSWPNYTLDDLYRPLVSVTFGTHYLKSMRDYQGSDVGGVLSYNAGPGAAQTWLNLAGDDLETLYEVISYDETKSYLDFIYVNHFMYQHLYASGAPDCRPQS